MDINNILGKIKQISISTENRYQKLVNKIQTIQPDIKNIIKVAKAAKKAGLIIFDFFSCKNSTYKNGDFLGGYDKLGFIVPSFVDQNIIGVGFNNFFADGSIICDKNRSNGRDRPANTENLEKFIEKFPEFEKAFYNYIEKVTGGKY